MEREGGDLVARHVICTERSVGPTTSMTVSGEIWE